MLELEMSLDHGLDDDGWLPESKTIFWLNGKGRKTQFKFTNNREQHNEPIRTKVVHVNDVKSGETS